ncbi:MAG: energy-coupling factor transporter transmembrane component T [Lachnospiraceae bacterium]
MISNNLDVRTKIALILFSSIAVFATSSKTLEFILVILMAILQIISGKKNLSIKLLLIYFVFWTLEHFLLPIVPKVLLMPISFFVISIRRLFPCAMAGLLLIKTTKVSELMSTLKRMKIPEVITIPLAITLRYLPAIKEEWQYINDAIKIRRVNSRDNLAKKLIRRIECYYVPLIVSATQVAEELTVASITRGIENPVLKTNMGVSRFGMLDCGVLLLTIVLIIGIILR